MKRLLVISYYWPPTGGSGVQRWVKFAKYLPSLGWQPVIYTPENPEQLAVDESLVAEVPAEAEIVKTRINEPYDIYRRLTGGKKKASEGGVNPLNSQKKSLRQKIAIWVRGNFFIPDPRVWWVRPSVRFLKEYLKEHPVDAIVTTGPPQSMHLIGRGLKRATGIRWVVDFRDPWTEMFYFKHLGLWPLAERRHHRLEKSVLDEADAIISVTPLVQKDFQAKTSTPVHMITNGFDPDDFKAEGSIPADRFTVVHTGLFASDGNPLELWSLLADKCSRDREFDRQLEIRLAGKTDPQILSAIEEAGLASKVVNLGYLQHAVTVVEQKSASILILPLRQEPEYRKVLPGKIFEYLASGRPVLGIGQEDGAAATVLNDTKVGRMFDWTNREGMEKFLEDVWKTHLENPSQPVGSDISKYSRPNLTRQLIELL